jgi:hypothetical protein
LGRPGRIETVGSRSPAHRQSPPAHIGEQKLAHCLLCAVRGLGVELHAVRHRGRRRAAMDRDRRGVDQHRHRRQTPRSLKERQRAAEVHAHAKVEIRLRRAGDDGGKVVDHVHPIGEKRGERLFLGDVACHGQNREGRNRRRWIGDVKQRQPGDRRAPQRARRPPAHGRVFGRETRHAGDENMHRLSPTTRHRSRRAGRW